MVAECVTDSTGNREPWRASEKGSDIKKSCHSASSVEMSQALTEGSWKSQGNEVSEKMRWSVADPM